MTDPVSIRDHLIGQATNRIRQEVKDIIRISGFEFARDAVAHVLNSEADRLPSTRKENTI